MSKASRESLMVRMKRESVRVSGSKEHSDGQLPVQQELFSTFDPAAMEAEANRMLQNGTMPSQEQWEAALARLRKEYGPKILKAREQDQRENSSETSQSTPSATAGEQQSQTTTERWRTTCER